MPLKILADEDIDFRLIKNLRTKGFEVMSVLKDYQGASDKEVLEIAKNREALLLTEDKDFGTWVFAHCEKCIGIITYGIKLEKLKLFSTHCIPLLLSMEVLYTTSLLLLHREN